MTAPDVQQGEYLIRGGIVLTMDPELGTLPHGDLHVRNGEIVAVGEGISAPDAHVIDAADMIVMPGLIDTHFHMWSTIGRNFINDGFEYFPAKWATSLQYDAEHFYDSVLLGLVEAANAGITTVHNWSHNTRTRAHADAELRAHRDGLIRARYAHGHPDMHPEDQAIDFTQIDAVRDEWFGSDSPFPGRVQLGVNLRGPDLGDMDVFHREMDDAQARGLPVAIHTMQGAETKVSVPELERHGYLGPDFMICHFLAATADDRAAMARTGTPLSYAVHSELRLGEAGDPRRALLKMRDDGVVVSLSIDASSIAPINLFEAMNVAWNMGIPWEGTDTADANPVTFPEVLSMATVNGAKALGMEAETGSLTVGKRADVILIRRTDLNVAPVVNVEATVVRSVTPANVDTVLADGRILKRGGELVAFDVDAIVAAAERSALEVRRRAGGQLAP